MNALWVAHRDAESSAPLPGVPVLLLHLFHLANCGFFRASAQTDKNLRFFMKCGERSLACCEMGTLPPCVFSSSRTSCVSPIFLFRFPPSESKIQHISSDKFPTKCLKPIGTKDSHACAGRSGTVRVPAGCPRLCCVPGTSFIFLAFASFCCALRRLAPQGR